MRRVCLLTGSRATYGYVRPVLRWIEASPNLELQLVVTGMHLQPEHGMTINDVLEDGFEPAARVEMAISSDAPSAWAKSLGVEIQSLAQVFDMLGPDLLLVTGDRGEMLAATVTAAYMNIPVCHIQAGDVSGHVDGSARHAITKLAHVHLASCADSAERVLKLGEEPWRVHCVGAPQLDDLMHGEPMTREALQEELQLDLDRPVALVIQHAVLTESAEAGRQVQETMEAVTEAFDQVVVILPNSDTGGREIITSVQRYADRPGVRVRPSLNRRLFLTLLRHVAVLVGNSSAGILEAPSIPLAAVDIGSRQRGRMRAANVIHVEEFDRARIGEALETALHDAAFRARLSTCENPYGDGKSAERIGRILETVELERLCDKRMTY